MGALRDFLSTHPRLAAAVVACALLLRLTIPTGYMVDVSDGRLAITLCPAYGPTTAAMPMAMAGHAHHHAPHRHDGAKPDQPCAFGGLAMHGLAAADPALLVAAIVFVMALALRPKTAAAAPASPFLRPPLRGPPATR